MTRSCAIRTQVYRHQVSPSSNVSKHPMMSTPINKLSSLKLSDMEDRERTCEGHSPHPFSSANPPVAMGDYITQLRSQSPGIGPGPVAHCNRPTMPFGSYRPVGENNLSGVLLQQDTVPESPSTPPAKATLHLVRSDDSLLGNSSTSSSSASSTTTTTTTTGTTSAAISNSLPLRLRPLIPSDEAVLRDIWIDGWEDTLVQKAPAMWHERVQKARVAVAVSATAAALCYTAACSAALMLLHRPSAPSQRPEWWGLLQLMLSTERFEGPTLPAVLDVLHVIAATSRCMLGVALVAAVLVVAGPLVVPLQLRLAILRVDFHRMVRRMCPDMWDMYGSWSRPDQGREYWVAELLPGGRVVGGAAIKMGVGVRPLAPPAAAPCAAHWDAHSKICTECVSGAAATAAAVQRLPTFPPENEAGFSDFDVDGHGPLESTDALVYRVVTDRAMRRCGIGRRLMEVLVARAAAVGVRRLVLVTANADAMDFYRRACGFELRPGARGYCGGKVFWREVRSTQDQE
ncbi:hypothetical protein Vretifemale_7923 [Volvox reticuliferus]|uniref:Probable N-acetyltransferase 14 n=1 Tax=Volvox reticuliferus TaxID=1737510 RepID=A0A8J4C9U8_9CHLO|nr:hypothetical protein Vretifemale_7923 [Volvox reticuliferus]